MVNLENLMLRKDKECLRLELGLAKASLKKQDDLLAETALPNLVESEDAYLENLAVFLREQLQLLSRDEKIALEILLDLDMLMLVDFALPKLSRKEEKEQIAWEVAESVPRKKDSFYYKVRKGKKNARDFIDYVIYTISKSFTDKLIGMAHGFDLEIIFIAPRLENATCRELEKCDLYPRDFKAVVLRKYLDKYAKSLFRLSLVFAFSLTCFMEACEFGVEREYQAVEQDAARLINWYFYRQQAQKIIDDIKKAKAGVKTIEKITVKQSSFFEALGRCTELGVWVTGVESVGTEYKVYGMSRDMLGIEAWCEELSLNSEYKGVQVVSTENMDDGLSFVVKVKKEQIK